MNLKDYLYITLGNRYAGFSNGTAERLAVLLNGLRGHGILLKHVPRWEDHELSKEELQSTLASTPVLMQHYADLVTIQARASLEGILYGGLEGLTIELAVLHAEAYVPVAGHLEEILSTDPDVEEEPAPSRPTNLEGGTWMASGVLSDNGKEYNLDDLKPPHPTEPLPPIVQVARLFRATVNRETGSVSGTAMENLAKVVMDLLAASRVKPEPQPQPELRSIWPANTEHWIYKTPDDVGKSLLPMAVSKEEDTATRERMREVGKDAVRAASGYGSSRIFNIEGFVEYLVTRVMPPFVEPAAPAPEAPAVPEQKQPKPTPRRIASSKAPAYPAEGLEK